MKNKNTGLKIMVIILSVLVAALSGYIVYDKVLSDEEIKEENTNEAANGENNSINNDTENNLNRYTVYQQCGGVIYYNPVNNSSCNKNEEGCLGWYVISKDTEQDATLDLILYKNLGNTVALNENGNVSEGPITALNYLKSLTQNWKVNVRMPSIDNVASVLDVKKNEDGNIGVLEVPKCLYSNGENREYWDGGYWLSDYVEKQPIFIIDCSRGLISAGNQFIKSSATNSTTWGIRPVITVEKNILR